MMDDVKWDDKYKIGVEDIDLQHHYFLNLINRIENEIKKADNYEYVKSLVSELNAYTKFHFLSEEGMMLHSGYPKLEEHKQLHYDLIQSLGTEQYKLLTYYQKGDERMFEIIKFLIEWFISHTNKEDREYAKFLKSTQN